MPIIKETNLGRLYKHFSEGTAFIVSAFRHEYDFSENSKRHQALKTEVRINGLGYIELVGYWKETNDEGEKVDVKELSLFVPYGGDYSLPKDNFKEFAIALLIRFEQESILYIDNSKIYSLSYDAETDEVKENQFEYDKFTPQKVSEIYSAIKKKPNKTFVLEGRQVPSGQIDAMIMKQEGYIF
jgi:hypothetical protein